MGVDAANNLYVLDQASPLFGRSVLTFAAGANGNVAPIRAIKDPLATFSTNHVTSLAVEGVGTVYVGTNNSLPCAANSILVFAPGSNGSVAPTKTITSPSLNGRVQAVGVDGTGNIFASVTSLGCAVQDGFYVFAPSASGASTPIRSLLAIAGSEFELFTNMAVDTTGNVIQTGYNNTGALANSVSVYANTTNGTATPTRVIRGGAQGVFTPIGLVFDGAGNLYVLNRGDQTVKVYAPGS